MQALGLIETKGLLAAIEAADTMVKSADVSILEKTYVGGGLVTIAVTGDVGAVKAAIEAGAAAVKKLDLQALISEHVIPRPHDELATIICSNTPVDASSLDKAMENKEVTVDVEDTEIVENLQIEEAKDADPVSDICEADDEETKEEIQEEIEEIISEKEVTDISFDNLHKEDVDNLVGQNGIEKTIFILAKLKVVKLRNLAREYKEFGIAGRTVSKAGKNLLLAKFKLYYEKR